MFQTANITGSVIISFVGMGVVFIGLVILYFSMILLKRLLTPKPVAQNPDSPDSGDNCSSQKRRTGPDRRTDGEDAQAEGEAAFDETRAKSENTPEDKARIMSEQAAAVVGLSLYLYNKKYDEAKHFILTGKKSEMPNKPWTMAGRLNEVSRDSARFSK